MNNKYQFDFTGMSRQRSRKELALLCAKIEHENSKINSQDLYDDLSVAAKGMIIVEKFGGEDAYVCFTVSVPFNENLNGLVTCGKYVSKKAKVYTPNNGSCTSNGFILASIVAIDADIAQFELSKMIIAAIKQ